MIVLLTSAKHALWRLFDIRPGESRRAFYMFAYIFLIISILLIIKPVSYSLFLSTFGANHLPYAYILVAVFAGGVSTFFLKALQRRTIYHLILGTLITNIAAFMFFWVIMEIQLIPQILPYLFFVWIAIFGVVASSQFWILANIIFNSREAKRLFGFIGAGAIAGAVFGGYLTNFLVPVLGSQNLLFICIAFFILCIFIAREVWNTEGLHVDQDSGIDTEKTVDNPRGLFKASSHLTVLASIVGVSILVAKFVDYQFSAMASANIPDEDSLAAFFGFWYSNMNVLSLLIQLFITRKIVLRLGVGTSLFFLPTGLLFGALAVFFQPALWSAIALKISDGSLKQSINKAGVELTALPLPAEIRNQGKTVIDIFIDSLASGLGGVGLIAMVQVFDMSVQYISLVVIGLIAIWFGLIFQVKKEYLKTFRKQLGKPSTDTSEATQEPVFGEDTYLGNIIEVLQSDNEQHILQALRIAQDITNNLLLPYYKVLIDHHSPEVQLAVLNNLYYYKTIPYEDKLLSLLENSSQEVRTETMRVLFRQEYVEPSGFLESYLTHPDDYIRNAALLCLAKESQNNVHLRQMFHLKELILDRIKNLKNISDFDLLQLEKSNLASVLGTAQIQELLTYLYIFLNDSNPVVRRSALQAAGQSRYTEFIPLIVSHLGKIVYFKDAQESLTKFGENILHHLQEFIGDDNEVLTIRLHIPKVLAEIGTARSTAILVSNLDHQHPSIRLEVLKALNQIRTRRPAIKLPYSRIEQQIFSEINDYVWLYSRKYSLNVEMEAEHYAGPDNSVRNQVENISLLLQQRMDSGYERIFRLLGLKNSPDDINSIYLNLRSNDRETRIKAMEFLDSVLDAKFKPTIIPLVELIIGFGPPQIAMGNLGIKQIAFNDCLTDLLTLNDDEIIFATLDLLVLRGDRRVLPEIGKLLSHSHRQVHERAASAIRNLGFPI
ncbi:MAG: hypothetical protein GF372_05380 [Candidatus Marinimicrobia bacterium]|nr:hypothetical protein [Candidatus Neomarinimicrobiota bacterium]